MDQHQTGVAPTPAPPGTRSAASGARGLGPVRVASAVDETADRLLTTIALGEFSVGERLPTERELTETLRVSRPTVRAAIARLQGLGCLEVVRGRNGGHYVRAGWHEASAPAVRRVLLPRWERIEAQLDTRCLIESLIARTAAERRDEADIRAITTALRRYERSATPEHIRNTDADLHTVISRAARNDELARYSQQLLREISAGFPIEPFRGNLTAAALADHRALADAVIGGRAEEAARLARSHFAITGQNLRDTLQGSLGTDSATTTTAEATTTAAVAASPGQSKT